jgi:aminoglycoside phosphotransferase (APT) family kinase protein
MTKDGSFKKVVRRRATETGQRYTEAKADIEGLDARIHHSPVAERLVVHLRDRYGIDAIGATQLSQHVGYVMRIDRRDGDPWVARAFPPARPVSGAEGDAAVLRFLERHDYPAERLAAEDPVSELEGSSVLVTEFVDYTSMPAGQWGTVLGDLLGRLHALPLDESVARPGGAEGGDSSREGRPRQDLLAALAFLDSVDTKVAAPDRDRFEELRERVRTADAGDGLPEALVHGNFLAGNPDHAVMTDDGPVVLNWKSAGRGPRLVDLGWVLWGCWNETDAIPVIDAYRRHVELNGEELDRLEAVMAIRPLYLTSFGYRRNILVGREQDALGFSDPGHLRAVAEVVRTRFAEAPSDAPAPA